MARRDGREEGRFGALSLARAFKFPARATARSHLRSADRWRCPRALYSGRGTENEANSARVSSQTGVLDALRPLLYGTPSVGSRFFFSAEPVARMQPLGGSAGTSFKNWPENDQVQPIETLWEKSMEFAR